MRKAFALCLLAIAIIAGAQDVKKVAILETVDKVGDVPYGVKLQVRMSLTYAISRTAGYEGYDRVDVSSISGEQSFQRTGMVSDAQIKKLGEMTGAQYVLIAEAAIYDQQNIIITAKVLDVETGGVANSAPPAFANKEPEKMQTACITLAQKLLGVSSSSPSYSSSHSAGYTSYQVSGYVDLGLPSGTRWKAEDEGNGNIFYYKDAIELFKGKLPTKNQYRELKNYCKWTWTGDGYKVEGLNGNFIVLPASGWRDTDGQYKRQGEKGWYIFIGGYLQIDRDNQSISEGTLTSCSVRLTQ